MALTEDQKKRLMGDSNYIKTIAGTAPTTGTPTINPEELKKQLTDKYITPMQQPVVPPTPPTPPKQSLLDKIGGKGSMLDNIGTEMGIRTGKVVEETKQNIQDIGTRYDNAKASGDKWALPKMALSATAIAPKAVSSQLFESVKAMMPNALKKDINSFIQTIVTNPHVKDQIITPLTKTANEHPDIAQAAQDVLDILSVLPAGKVASELKQGLGIAEREALSAASKGKQIVTDAAATAKTKIASNIAKKAEEKAASVATKGSFLKGKTLDQILATPTKDLKKLSDAERAIYYSNAKGKTLEEFNAVKEKAKQTLSQKTAEITAKSGAEATQSQKEIDELTKQVSRTSTEEAQKLKPQLLSTMKKNSKVYSDLVEKEIAPVKDVKVSHDELISDINSKFQDDPMKAKDLIDTLKLKPGESTTIGGIYENTKKLRQGISTASKKGTTVFTPEEMKINNAVSHFSDFLKGKGVDLKEANKFWSNYAPMRDKLVKSIQPFTPKGAESPAFASFSKKIEASVAGKDPYNENFIKATEDLLGTKIGNKETRDAIALLDSAKKKQVMEKLANDVAEETAKLQADLDIKLAKKTMTKAQEKLAIEEFNTQRDALPRKRMITALKWVLGGATATAAGQTGLNMLSQ